MYQNLIANTMTVQSSKHPKKKVGITSGGLQKGWVYAMAMSKSQNPSPVCHPQAIPRNGQRPAFTVGRTQNIEPKQHRAHLGSGMSR